MADTAETLDPTTEHPEDEVIRDESERFLFAEFKVGADLEDFLRSDTGRYLQGVACQEIGTAIRTFLNHDLSRNADLVARAQISANRARDAFRWMLEAVQSGRAAEFHLRQLDDLENQ